MPHTFFQPKPVHYRLTYFDLRGRAEAARQLFALANVPYDDVRISFDEWPAAKKELALPYGQLPILEVDGLVMAQSVAISRFLARRFGYYGANDVESAQIDEICDAMTDYFDQQRDFFPVYIGRIDGDKEKAYKELFEPARDKLWPIIIERFLKRSTNGFLVGSSLSLADLVVAEHVNRFDQLVPHAWDKYPELKAHRDLIHQVPAIKDWIAKRPDNPF